jgi:hypothetical protein
MSFEALLTHTITVIHQSDSEWDVDDEGNTIPPIPVETDYSGLLQQREAKEVQIGPDTFTTDADLFLPIDALVTGWDRARKDGEVFEVVGEPNYLDYGAIPHVEAQLRRITTEGSGGS